MLEIKEHPQQLYCAGNTQLLKHNKIVAIVGSRNCTEYGRKYAQKFANELAKKEICVISGLAVGIDASAHCGAIGEIGSTIAVLGGGLKNVYPRENLWLYNKILNENGCIITEYEETEETKTSNFPKRNRIISGIADAVLVIEATHRSGSKITAKYAKAQGKQVYCIPVNLDQKNSAGINELIAEGAKIVTSPSQLISDLYGKNTENDNINNKMQIKEKNINIPKQYEEIYNELEEDKTLEELAIRLNKSVREVNSTLTIMEINGYVEQYAGNNFRRIVKK